MIGRRASSPQVLQTAGRLRGLRIRLTVLLLVLNVVGLAGMGTVALVVDQQQRDQLVSADLARTASTAAALLYYDSGSLHLDNLFNDPTAQGATAVYVYEGGRTDVSLVFAHPAGLRVIPPANLLAPARRVWHGGTRLTGSVAAQNGDQLHMLAVPFWHESTAGRQYYVYRVPGDGPG